MTNKQLKEVNKKMLENKEIYQCPKCSARTKFMQLVTIYNEYNGHGVVLKSIPIKGQHTLICSECGYEEHEDAFIRDRSCLTPTDEEKWLDDVNKQWRG